MRTLKTFFFYFLSIIIIVGSSAMAQDLTATYSLTPPTKIVRNTDVIVGKFLLANNTTEDISVAYIKELIEIEGSQLTPLSEILLLSQDGSIVGEGYPYGNTIQDFFKNQGTGYIWMTNGSLVITAGTQMALSILVHVDSSAMGKFRMITSGAYGTTTLSNAPVHLYKPVYHEWETIEGYVPSGASLSLPYVRIIAPGTKNFSMDIWAQSSNPIEGVDAVLNYPGDNPLIYAVGNFIPSQYQYAGWTSAGNTIAANTTRIIAYGTTPQEYIDLGNQYFRLSDIAQKGDSIPVSFGMATMNDTLYPTFTNCWIIVGPSVVFGDANGDKAVTVMDLVSIIQYMSSYTIVDTGAYLKTRLASDLDGNGVVDSYDLYLERQILLQPYFTPPIADPYYFSGSGGMGKVAAKETLQPILSFKKMASGDIAIYANVPVTNGDLYIPGMYYVTNGDMQSFGSALQNGKTHIFFAADSGVSDQALCIIKDAPTQIMSLVTGFVNNHIPIKVTSVTGIHDSNPTTPKEFGLTQNYPNPFNPTTEIKYTLPNDALVNITIYNILGEKVATLIDGEKSAGIYTIRFDGSMLASGTYIYRLQAGTFVSIKKMILMK